MVQLHINFPNILGIKTLKGVTNNEFSQKAVLWLTMYLNYGHQDELENHVHLSKSQP